MSFTLVKRMSDERNEEQMKKRILKVLVTVSVFTGTFFMACKADEEAMCRRTESAVYHDYLVIETKDGHIWELADDADSKYLENTFINDMLVRKAIFEEGELVRVTFDTCGTASVSDDIVLNVQ